MPRLIPLTKNDVTMVPNQCHEKLMEFNWYSMTTCGIKYAARSSRKNEGGEKRRAILMHRFIWEMVNGPIPEGKMIDHIDGDGLNNTLENLRLCNLSQNGANAPKKTSSGQMYKGICPIGKKWEARICVARRQIYLGCFDSEIEAARAYDLAALHLQGEFASLNFPNRLYPIQPTIRRENNTTRLC
jgi:hypothetical protein